MRPSARMSHAVSVDGVFTNKMYLFGGSGFDVGQQNMNDLWVLDLEEFSFEEVRQSQSKN